MLQNQIYLGKIVHKDAIHQGTHAPIIDQAVWDRVQVQFASNLQAPRKRPRSNERSLLAGLIFDREGNRFVPTHANKKGKRYRYYVSQLVIKREKGAPSGPMRIPAVDIEELVLDQLKHLLSPKRLITMLGEAKPLNPTQLRLLMQSLETMDRDMTAAARGLFTSAVNRVEVGPDQVEIFVSRESIHNLLIENDPAQLSESRDDVRIQVIANVARCGGEVRLLLPADPRDRKSRQVPSLIRAIVRAHQWVDKIVRGEANNQRSIAKETGFHVRYISRILPLAFLAPDITEAILNGTLPAHLSLASFPGILPVGWEQQRIILG